MGILKINKIYYYYSNYRYIDSEIDNSIDYFILLIIIFLLKFIKEEYSLIKRREL